MKLAHSKASGWVRMTAEVLGERMQALAIATEELMGVDEVEVLQSW